MLDRKGVALEHGRYTRETPEKQRVKGKNYKNKTRVQCIDHIQGKSHNQQRAKEDRVILLEYTALNTLLCLSFQIHNNKQPFHLNPTSKSSSPHCQILHH